MAANVLLAWMARRLDEARSTRVMPAVVTVQDQPLAGVTRTTLAALVTGNAVEERPAARMSVAKQPRKRLEESVVMTVVAGPRCPLTCAPAAAGHLVIAQTHTDAPFLAWPLGLIPTAHVPPKGASVGRLVPSPLACASKRRPVMWWVNACVGFANHK